MICRQIAEGILKSSGISGYQLGTSKVFLRAGQMAMLDKQRTEKLSKAATVMQRHARGWLARLHYKQDLLAVVRMQVRPDMWHVCERRVWHGGGVCQCCIATPAIPQVLRDGHACPQGSPCLMPRSMHKRGTVLHSQPGLSVVPGKRLLQYVQCMV